MSIYKTVSNYKCSVPTGQRGNWRIERFAVTKEDAELERLRAIFSSSRGRSVPEGTYTRLMRNSTLVMSDTPDELSDCLPFLYEARGDVLINGLGLGTTVDLVLSLPEVGRVTVVEIAPEVITLVGPHLLEKYGERLDIIEADALTWKPPTGKRYSAVWHDIWDNICADNLPEMHRLHRRYGRRCDWQGSWCRERCEWQRE